MGGIHRLTHVRSFGTISIQLVGQLSSPRNPDPDRICTSIIERQNLTIRMQTRRPTRLMNGFSKKWENLWAALCLHFAHYNFCRIHKTLRGSLLLKRGPLTACGRWPTYSNRKLPLYDRRGTQVLAAVGEHLTIAPRVYERLPALSKTTIDATLANLQHARLVVLHGHNSPMDPDWRG
jgi:hypothetical protein